MLYVDEAGRSVRARKREHVVAVKDNNSALEPTCYELSS